MKFSVFTVMMPDCSLEKTVELLQSHGYDGVEWRFTKSDASKRNEAPSFWANNLSTIESDASEEELLALKQLADDAGLEVPNLAAYIASGDLAATERAMRAAKLLGAPSIRIGVPGHDRTRHYADLLKEARAYLKETEEMSRTYGVKGLVEVHHGNIACSASLARQLVDGFDADRIGIIYDPGNMVHEGFEQYRLGLEVLGDYLGHVHVKNADWKRTEASLPSASEIAEHGGSHDPLWRAVWGPLSGGVVHWPTVLADLKAIGYDGWLSFEDFSASAPTETLLRNNLAYIKSLL